MSESESSNDSILFNNENSSVLDNNFNISIDHDYMKSLKLYFEQDKLNIWKIFLIIGKINTNIFILKH